MEKYLVVFEDGGDCYTYLYEGEKALLKAIDKSNIKGITVWEVKKKVVIKEQLSKYIEGSASSLEV